ncbi:hypothetical protein [Paenibacillus sp. 7516]|uniref:hypothetical protein n=1 Tax=Paenibacillus sp. 7516 TaxID=2022549 RepID=UPI000BA60B25|nr:hypothetical protein [Paenibacillus sp. 7516]PAF33425.1 hypothetical protein CHI14_03175 [Paenibacillus sp. 7516]
MNDKELRDASGSKRQATEDEFKKYMELTKQLINMIGCFCSTNGQVSLMYRIRVIREPSAT